MTLRKLSMQGASIILVAVMLSSAIPASLAETGTNGLSESSPQSQPSLPTFALFDNFTADSKLNTTLWTVNGSVSKIVFSKVSPLIVDRQPILSFSNKSGMAMSGVFREHRAASIQSLASFSLPFAASTRVLGKLSDGNPFVFGISTSNGSKNLIIAGNLNSSNPAYGINYGPAGGPYNKLVSNPSIGVWYTLHISVNSTGYAKLSAVANGKVVGAATEKVGTGHFYLILGQFEASPPTAGPNKSFWKWVEVAKGR